VDYDDVGMCLSRHVSSAIRIQASGLWDGGAGVDFPGQPRRGSISVVLMPRVDGAIGQFVFSHRTRHIFALTTIEPWPIISRYVPSTGHQVINVIAISPSIRPVVTRPDAELVRQQKLGPLHELVPISEYHAADGVAPGVPAVRVHFSSIVIHRNIDLGEISSASNLNIVRGGDIMHATEGAGWDESCAVGWLSAVRHGLPLRFGDASKTRRSKQAEV